MAVSYDEDITVNRFFTTLQAKHRHLYEQAMTKRCMICVPRTGVFARHSLTQKDFENHILQGDEEHPGFFTSLNNKELQITSAGLATRNGFDAERVVKILFEETFYNDSDESFRVVCIDRLLEGGTDIVEDPVLTCLETVDDCAEFLWGHKHSKTSQQQVDAKIQDFLNSHEQFQSTRAIIDATSDLFTLTMQIALRDSVLKRLVKQNKGHMLNLKVAMETYVMHEVSTKVLKQLIQLMANEDSKLNKTTRNLSDLQVRDLQVRQDLTVNLPRARRELSQLNQYSTPLEKLHCLRRTIATITQPGYRDKLQLGGTGAAMSSDDLLPLLIFLVVKSEIPNWLANLTYMQHFRFANFGHGEFGFYLASFEAAIEHVRSGSLSAQPLGSPDGNRLNVFRSSSQQESLWQRQGDTDTEYTPTLELFFKCVRDNNTERLRSLLESGFTDDQWILEKMCHPLCLCDKCQDLLISTRSDPRALTSSSRNDRGYTAMHTAAIHGCLESMELLHGYKGDINVTDYHGSTPLHLACQKGYQREVIWLLDKGAEVNLEDNDGNTPLHLCCANGHEDCVKALLYSGYGGQKIEINAANTRGDTSLHLAAKWGYENILVLLLEHGASLEARNRRKETPLMCSQNLNIARKLVPPTDEETFEEINGPTTALETMMSRQSSDSSNSTGSTGVPAKHRRSKSNSSINFKEVEKLLRSVADGDMVMVRHQLGWSSDEEDEFGEEMETWSSNTDLCHPLCQCNKCSVLQKRTVIVNDSGLNVNSCNLEGYASLHVASLHGHASLVDLLLRRGANVNSWNNTTMQATPLHLACQSDHAPVVSKLLKFGAKCNMKDTNGNTPLHYCCMNGFYECAVILIGHGANVDQSNYRGNTPLHEAARGNHAKLVSALIEGNANPLSRNKAQLTPLQLAQNDDVAGLIESSSLMSSSMQEEDDTETTTSSSLSLQNEEKDGVTTTSPSIQQSGEEAAADDPSTLERKMSSEDQDQHLSIRDSGESNLQELQERTLTPTTDTDNRESRTDQDPIPERTKEDDVGNEETGAETGAETGCQEGSGAQSRTDDDTELETVEGATNMS